MYRVVVKPAGEYVYSSNQLEFDTIQDADEYGADLFSRWLALTDYAILPTAVKPDQGGHWSETLVAEERIDA